MRTQEKNRNISKGEKGDYCNYKHNWMRFKTSVGLVP